MYPEGATAGRSRGGNDAGDPGRPARTPGEFQGHSGEYPHGARRRVLGLLRLDVVDVLQRDQFETSIRQSLQIAKQCAVAARPDEERRCRVIRDPKRFSLRVDCNAVGARRLVGERHVEAAAKSLFERRLSVIEQRLERGPVANGYREVDRRGAPVSRKRGRLDEVLLQRGALLAIRVPVEGDQSLRSVAVAVEEFRLVAVEGKTGPGALETDQDRMTRRVAGDLSRSKLRKQPRRRTGCRHEPDQAARLRGGSPRGGQTVALGAPGQGHDAVAEPGRPCEVRLRRWIAQQRELAPRLADADAVSLELIAVRGAQAVPIRQGLRSQHIHLEGERRQLLETTRNGGRCPVAVRKQRLVDRPVDSDLRVVPGDHKFVGPVVVVVAFVLHVGGLADHTEAVSKTARDVELAKVVLRQDAAGPTQKRRRAAPDVHGDIEDLASRNANQLRLLPAALEVESAQSGAAGPRVVVLNPRSLQAAFTERGRVVALQEEAAAVPVNRGIDDHHVGQSGAPHPGWSAQRPSSRTRFR